MKLMIIVCWSIYRFDVIYAKESELLEISCSQFQSPTVGVETLKVLRMYVNQKILQYYAGGVDALAPDYAQLLQVAMQCPDEGGPAVFNARALLGLLDDHIIYDDENVCLQAGYYRQQQGTPAAIKTAD